MHAILFGMLILTALIVAYILVVRPWLRKRPWAAGFFALIEPVELTLWNKSESILWARTQMVWGVVLLVAGHIFSIDISIFGTVIPEWMQPWWPIIITAYGIIGEWLRRDTTKPLAVVAIPQDAPLAVTNAVARAEVANDTAVAVAKASAAAGA